MNLDERIEESLAQALETAEGRWTIREKLQEVHGRPFTEEEMMEFVCDLSPRTARRYGHFLKHKAFEPDVEKKEVKEEKPNSNLWDTL